MDKGTIIIADRDSDFGNRLAGYFRNAGYQVETSESVAALLQMVFCHRSLVLLLDSDFDGRIPVSELVHLLKKCHARLQVVLMSDQVTLPLARKVRAEGVFYHALRPSLPEENEELALAVEAALAKGCGCDAPCTGWSTKEAGSGNNCAQVTAPAERFCRKVVSVIVLSFISAGAGLAAAAIVLHRGISLTLGIFAAFSAFIVIGQLLPIFRIQLPERLRHGRRRAAPVKGK